MAQHPKGVDVSIVPNGSIMRVAWADELLSPEAEYDQDVDDGWDPPGVMGYWSKKDVKRYRQQKRPAFTYIPHGTKGLLVIDYWLEKLSRHDILWYQVLWGEKTYFVGAANLVLIKKGTTPNELS